MKSPTAVLAAIALVCTAAVAAALTLQHGLDYQPCAWCVLQRLIFLAISLAALLGLAWRERPGRLASASLVTLLAMAGVAAALWQHFVAAAAASCDLTLAERVISMLKLDEWLPQVFAAYASCKDAAVRLLGVPFEFYSLTLFMAIGLAATLLLVSAPRAAASLR